MNPEQPEQGYGGSVCCVMMARVSENAARMRALAARLRGHAAETGLDMYRRKFEEIASELEEAAVVDEDRARFRGRFRLAS